MRMKWPGPTIPTRSMGPSARPYTRMPRAMNGLTKIMSSTTNATSGLPARTFRNLRVSRTDAPEAPIQKYVPSNSNATGTTSGWPPDERVASRARS
jgi:hypothetical protein